MELIGVSMIMPLVSIIMDESILKKEAIYIWIGRLLHLQSARDYILTFSLFLIAVYIIKNVYIICQSSLQYRFVYNNQRRLSTKMLGCYLKQDYLFFVSNNVAELQRNITTDAYSFLTVILAVIQFAAELLVCILLVLYLLYINLFFTISIVFLLAVLFSVFLYLYKKFSVEYGIRYRKLIGAQNKWALQAFTGVKEIKVMNKEGFFLNHYDESYKKACVAQRKNAMLNAASKPIIETICICSILSIIAVRTYMGLDMKELIPVLSAFAVAIFRLLPSFNRLSGYVNTILFGKPAVDNIYKDLKEVEKLLAERKDYIKDDCRFDMENNIEIKNICFKYPGGEKEILENVSLKIPPNKSVALIGPSGAGKSTLADVILGILIPQDGRVEVSGRDIHENPEAWHENIGYIPQMIYLMNDSVRNNVAFGIQEKEIREDKVWEALREAQMEEFVKSLPEGLDTQIGDSGLKLSGGQRQRLGIARALYTEPRLLILDEATSALDNETETAVMEAIDSLHGSRTMIIIAHRLTTIRNCDVIYEVKDKKVVERKKEKVLS